MAIEIRPASLAQVVDYRGRRLLIEEDVTDVAVRLAEIDPCLKLFCMEDADPVYWQVERHVPEADGSVTEQLVLTSHDLGSHIVDRVALIGSSGYDFVAEVEKQDREADKRADAMFTEKRHAVLEELAHAFRKDMGLKKNF